MNCATDTIRYCRVWCLAVLVAALMAPVLTSAATVTINEPGLDAIFSQASFGVNDIDIRFNPTFTIVNASLLDITTEAELTTLFSLSPDAVPGVNLFFVNALDYCGSFDTGILGCAKFAGNDIVVESAIGAGANGAELIAHELGHPLGLAHVSTGLMNASTFGDTSLTAVQVSAILASSMIQLDGEQRYIQITPILVTAVPLPAGLPLLLGAVGLLCLLRKSDSQQV